MGPAGGTAASYEVVYSADASVENCGVVPFEGEGKPARPIAPERLVLRRNLNQSFSGAWCEDLADEQRAALGIAKPAAPK